MVAAALDETDPFLKAFLDSGMSPPSVPGATTAEEELIPFLRAAAEIEHALMVQYLYAYFTSATNEQDRTRVFLRVAIQEMGHLFTVQNLLRAFDQEVHLILPDPTMPGVDNTFPFPLLLQRASIESLAQYVTAESPLADTLPEPLKTTAKNAIADAAIEVRHVGLLFLKIYWLVQPSEVPFGPWQPPLATGWKDVLGERHLPSALNLKLDQQRSWRASWDVAMDDPAFLENSASKTLFVGQIKAGAVPLNEQVCRTLFSIGTQGEGWVTDDAHTSHFELFANLYESWKPPGNLPATIVNAVMNPWVGAPSADPLLEAHRITYPEAEAIGKAFNLRYERILLLIALTFTEKAASLSATLRMQAVGGEMSGNISLLATELLVRPLKEGGSAESLRAGPPFQAPAAIPTTFENIRIRLASLKMETEQIALPGAIAIDTTPDSELLTALDQLP